MATTPTNRLVWAADAFKKDYGSTREENGWPTLGSQMPLGEQNYYQNSVSEWLTFFSNNLEEIADTEVNTFIDFWEWDSSRIDSGGDAFDPFLSSIAVNGSGDLEFINDSGVPASDDWDLSRGDCLTGARYWEAMDMLNRGLGIKIIDANDDAWIIVGPNVDQSHIAMSGALNSLGDVRFRFNGNAGLGIFFNNIQVQNFDGFAQLTPANFITHNPSGIRVGMMSMSRLFIDGLLPNTSAGAGNMHLTTNFVQRKKWIRPLNVSNATTNPGGSVSFNLFLKLNRYYKQDLQIVKAAAPAPKTLLCDNLPFSMHWQENEVAVSTTALTRSLLIGYGPVDWTIDPDFVTPGGTTTDVNDIYGYGNFYSNYVIIEEQ